MRLAGRFLCGSEAAYVEMRGTLRWVYTVVANPEPFDDVGAILGFRPLADLTTDVGGQILYSAVLDMGPGSVDAWLADLMELKSRRRTSNRRNRSMSRPMSSC